MTDCEDSTVRPVSLFIANAGGTLDALVNVVNDAFQSSVAHTEALLGIEGVNVLVLDAPDDVIPEWEWVATPTGLTPSSWLSILRRR